MMGTDGRTSHPRGQIGLFRVAKSARTAQVRLGKRTKALAPTLDTRSWAVIDHPDLDAVAAYSLLKARPAAVVNCSLFVTGKYPNQGPAILLDAGIALYEAAPDLFDLLTEGELISHSAGNWIRSDGSLIPGLRQIDRDYLISRMDAARENLDGELVRFARNTVAFLERREERSLLLDSPELPEICVPIAGRHVLVAVRGSDFERDLARLTPYFRDRRPVVIAVDGAADTLARLAIPVDILIGDMDSVSDDGLKAAKQIIVHAHRDVATGHLRSPGAARVSNLKLEYDLFAVPGTSEDAALLLAYEKGADLIVAVGTHSNLEDFLDKGRGGMASSFLVRLKVGSRLVDARGVSRLHGERPSAAPWYAALVVSAAFPVLILAAGTPFGQMVGRAIRIWWRTFLP